MRWFSSAQPGHRVQEDISRVAGNAETRSPQCVPVIGVAKTGWTLEQLKARAHDNVDVSHNQLRPADRVVGHWN